MHTHLAGLNSGCGGGGQIVVLHLGVMLRRKNKENLCKNEENLCENGQFCQIEKFSF